MNPFAPLLAAAQGARLRRTTERLPPAAGPTAGAVPGPGETAMRLLVIGDSTAAGVGAADHGQALVGALAREAAEDAGVPVEWRVVARAGATSRRVRYSLLPHLDEERRYDLAVLLMGVNDVLARRGVDEWRDNAAAVLDRVAERSGLVVMAGVPPFDRFPAMPRTLGRHLARSGRGLDEAARRLCRDRERVVWIDSTGLLPEGRDCFARDGFHPSTAGYALWAAAIWDRAAAAGAHRPPSAAPSPNEPSRER